MNTIREYMNRPLVMGVAGLIVGILLGIFYGWVIDPVEWTDAAIIHLRPDLQEEYLRMAIDSYAQNRDAELAKKRFAELGENGETILEKVMDNPAGLNLEALLAFKATVQAAPGTALTLTPPPSATEQRARSTAAGVVRWLLPAMCVIFLAIAAGVVYLLFWRPRAGGKGLAIPRILRRESPPATEWREPIAPAEEGIEPPMVQFMSSYKLGDDLFDESYSIDSPSGEFLGECGVGISETVGVGEPKRVTAFEVWLFDKNDIQTVTKVLMSAHAFLDEATRQRLAAKGEPVLAEPGSELVLETQTLRMVARVVDMAYGQGALPENSFFERMLLELAVWQKPA